MLGDFGDAVATARTIQEPQQRIELLLQLGEMQARPGTPGMAKAAEKTYLIAFEAINALDVGRSERARLFLNTAKALIAADRRKAAGRILDHTYPLLTTGVIRVPSPLITQVTAAFVDIGRKDRAMEVVRGLPDDAQRARTLASIARTTASREGIESAVPLFLLAVRDARAISDEESRYDVFRHIVVAQTRAGRLADAFTSAGRIKDVPNQERALFAIGTALLETGQSDAALKLVDYIADIGMRAHQFVGAARRRMKQGDKKRAAALIQQALAPTGRKPAFENITEAMMEVFEAQVELGPTPGHAAVFERVRSLLANIPDTPAKVPILTRLARAEARGKQKAAVERSLGHAWRLARLARNSDEFPALLQEISTTQFDAGDLLMAFDTAARIPNRSGENDWRPAHGCYQPRHNALLAVALAAARRGFDELTLRALHKIDHVGARASGYSAVAFALPVPVLQARMPKAPPEKDTDAASVKNR